MYATIHLDKATHISGALGSHIDRKHIPDNADPTKQGANYAVVMVDGGLRKVRPERQTPLSARVGKRLAEGYKGKKAIRKDAVKAVNVILTGSHDALSSLSTKEVDRWAAANWAFLAKRYGRENIAGFVVHLDERTPHIHATIVPLTADGRLSAKEVVGNAKSLAALQDDYAAKMAAFGLKRGEKGKKVRHVTTAEYYKAVNRVEELTSAVIDEVERVEISDIPRNPLKWAEWRENEQKRVDAMAERVEEIRKHRRSLLFPLLDLVRQSRDVTWRLNMKPGIWTSFVKSGAKSKGKKQGRGKGLKF